jgi:deoxyribose-phosphate aldolase
MTPSSRRSRRRSPTAPSEIDIVITREHVLTGNWQALYDEMRDAAPPAAPPM